MRDPEVEEIIWSRLLQVVRSLGLSCPAAGPAFSPFWTQ